MVSGSSRPTEMITSTSVWLCSSRRSRVARMTSSCSSRHGMISEKQCCAPSRAAAGAASALGLTAVLRVARAVVVGREPPRVHLPQQGRDGDGREGDGDEQRAGWKTIKGRLQGVWSAELFAQRGGLAGVCAGSLVQGLRYPPCTAITPLTKDPPELNAQPLARHPLGEAPCPQAVLPRSPTAARAQPRPHLGAPRRGVRARPVADQDVRVAVPPVPRPGGVAGASCLRRRAS